MVEGNRHCRSEVGFPRRMKAPRPNEDTLSQVIERWCSKRNRPLFIPSRKLALRHLLEERHVLRIPRTGMRRRYIRFRDRKKKTGQNNPKIVDDACLDFVIKPIQLCFPNIVYSNAIFHDRHSSGNLTTPLAAELTPQVSLRGSCPRTPFQHSTRITELFLYSWRKINKPRLF